MQFKKPRGIINTESKQKGDNIHGKCQTGYGNRLRQKADGADGGSGFGWPGGQSAL